MRNRHEPRHNAAMSARPALVIAHRGASALRPEHTLAAYALAIAEGADFIEPDLVPTRDGVLVARHENEIGGTTDVAQHPEFAARRTSRVVDGRTVEGWFTEDFTLAELKTLRARERLPALRSTAHDGLFEVPTFAEILELAASASGPDGAPIGVIPEIKHSTYFRGIGLDVEDRFVAMFDDHACLRRAPVVVQSFETGNLRALHARLRDRGNVALMQLIGKPAGVPADGGPAYAQMTTPEGLRAIATYAQWIGVPSRAVVTVDAQGRLDAATALVADAHAAGLRVGTYTFRPENSYLPRALWRGEAPGTVNPEGSIAEIRAHLAAGIDAFFTDHPGLGRAAVDGG